MIFNVNNLLVINNKMTVGDNSVTVNDNRILSTDNMMIVDNNKLSFSHNKSLFHQNNDKTLYQRQLIIVNSYNHKTSSMTYISFNIRNSELPFIAKFLKVSVNRDKNDFINFSNLFADGYIEEYESRIEAVNKLKSPKILTSELKKVTQRMYKNKESMRPFLNRLKMYAKMSKNGLKIKPEDFGIIELKKQIYRRDTEAVLEKIKIVLSNINDNYKALSDKGMKSDIPEILKQKYDDIAKDNFKQNEIISNRAQLTSQNKKVMNHLWIMISEISKTGQAIYGFDNPEKAKNYTISVLRERVRNEWGNNHSKQILKNQ